MSDAPADAQVTPRILVFFDYACQFCYLDWPRFKRLRAEHGAELFLVPYELRPAMPAEGVRIDELGGHHSEHVEEHMKLMAAEGGLDLVFPDFVPNTHFALSLGEYARALGPEAHEAVHEAIFTAYRYEAAELSFPAPAGLSGGPVFSAEDPNAAMALVAENRSSTTYVGRTEDLLLGV